MASAQEDINKRFAVSKSDKQIMEYREVKAEQPFGLTVTAEQLNVLAAEGWRVVAVSFDVSHDMRRVLLEREKP